jgi:hypothetical protein
MVKSVDIVSSAVVETDYEEIKGLLMANQSAIKDLKKEIAQLRRRLVAAESRKTIKNQKKEYKSEENQKAACLISRLLCSKTDKCNIAPVRFMAKSFMYCIMIVSAYVILSVAVMSAPINAQQNQSASNASNATSGNATNMSNFPTRTTPGNITNSTAAENVTIAPAK